MSAINIIVADNHPIVVSGIHALLKSSEDLQIVATCSDGVEALRLIRELQPNIAVLDISMPKLNGIDILSAVNREKLPTRILFFTAMDSPRHIFSAMAEGAYGFLRKDARPYELVHCIREIAAGRKCLTFELLGVTNRDKSTSAIKPRDSLLTRREWKVMELAAEGRSNKEIGRRLGMTTGTAKLHLYHVFKKIGVKKRSALATLAYVPSSDQGRTRD